MKYVYFALGWLFFGLGLVGAFLPVLPTTPLMILALWCFSKSSERFHNWLYNHRLFGPSLRQWDEHRVIPVSAKVISVSFMTMSMLYMIFYTPIQMWMLVLIGLFLVSVAVYVLGKPSKPPGVSE